MKKNLNILILLLLVLTACSENKLDVDVSGIELEIQFDRFEQSMFAANSVEEMSEINKQLISDGGELYEFYVYDILRSGSVFDDSVGMYLYYFVSDSIMQSVNKNVQVTFENFSVYEDQLTGVFKHLKYHLPGALMPNQIITYNSAFNYGVISSDKAIGVGLEMYLGPENRIVKQIGFPVYVKDKMDKSYLLVDVAHSWIETNILQQERGETFLSNMIYFGKLRYLIEAANPRLEKELIIRYSKEEYDYAVASEYNIWQYLVDMNWIYSNDIKVILRFFEEAPTTVGIDNSPGRLGQFIGWQMVKSFMEKNQDITIEELVFETNEAKILKAYKPKENE